MIIFIFYYTNTLFYGVNITIYNIYKLQTPNNCHP